MHSNYNTLPFDKLLAKLMIKMAKAAVFWLNAFPPTRSISATLSPQTLITGQEIDYHQHCKYQFGEYAQTNEEHDSSMHPCTMGTLALIPTGNVQGNFLFHELVQQSCY